MQDRPMSRRDFARVAAGGGLAMLGAAALALGEIPPEGVRPMNADTAAAYCLPCQLIAARAARLLNPV